MAAQALYRRWRSQTFDEIVGQAHVIRTLRNALREGRLAHAYLFAGPRGTGKTSTARILAKAVNCLAEPEERPCNRCAICQAITEGRLLDLIEIDAASNTSVDDVRELRDKVGFRPNEARVKFYIIDEVHMLSNSAFNALLKTLEEPPPHVVFVLCTTEPHRIPATVLSRCQRFDFHRLTTAEIVGHLSRILAAEGHEAEPEALALIARAAAGSMRDAISLLDQLLAYGERRITVAQVRDVLGMIPERAVGEWALALARGDVAEGLARLHRFLMEGVELRELARQMLAYLRGALVLKVGGDEELLDVDGETLTQMREVAEAFSAERLVRAIHLFGQAAAELRASVHPQLPLELAFVEAATFQPGEAASEKGEVVAAEQPGGGRAADRPEDAPRAPVEATGQADGAAEREDEKLALLRRSWDLVRRELQARSPAAVGTLSSRRGVRFLAVEGREVIIGYDERGRYSVEQVLQRPDVVEALEQALSKVFGEPHTVRYVPMASYRPKEGAGAEEAAPARDPASEEAQGSDPLVEVARQWGAEVEPL